MNTATTTKLLPLEAMLLFTPLIFSMLGLWPQPTGASTVDVFPGQSIQNAINSASVGDRIFVHTGTYVENLAIGKTLTLVGEGMGNTVVDGGGKEQSVIEVTASEVVISGFTVQNTSREAGTSFAGIKISGSTCNVTGNYVTKCKIGISVTSGRSRIAENIVVNTGHGIALYSSSEVTVESNNVSANTIGISLAFSSHNRINGNRAVNSSAGGHGIYVSSSSFNNTISANYLVGNYHGMWFSSSSDNTAVENTVANNELLGIELANSPENTFYHNNFVNNGQQFMRHIKIDDNSDGVWDDSYPSGGNYWHDYALIAADENSGPSQDQLGSDGICDNPYVIDGNNRDNYPSAVSFGNISDVITVINGETDQVKPTAIAGENKTVTLGTLVTFDARESTDNVGIISYEWDFGDGSQEQGALSTHIYNETGTYTVTLTVRDAAQNFDITLVTVTVTGDNADNTSYFWIIPVGALGTLVVAAAVWKHRTSSGRKKRKRRVRRIRSAQTRRAFSCRWRISGLAIFG